jgi:adhesin HecA-like repeat protein
MSETSAPVVRLLQPTLAALQATVDSCALDGAGGVIDLDGATIEDAGGAALELRVPGVTLRNGALEIKGDVVISAAAVALQGVRVRGRVRVTGQGASATFGNCSIKSRRGKAKVQQLGLVCIGEAASALLDNCSVSESDGDGVQVKGVGSVLHARSCSDVFNRTVVLFSAKATLDDCELSGNHSGLRRRSHRCAQATETIRFASAVSAACFVWRTAFCGTVLGGHTLG